MISLREMLFDESPYKDFDASSVEPDLQGWGSDHPIFERLIQSLRPNRVLEVGSWKGRSAINMATHLRKAGLAAEMICVDTWLGSPEHWLRAAPGYHESLKLRNGYPTVYNTFLANVVRAGLTDIITPYASTSESAFHVFRQKNYTFDLIYLDAAHEFDAVTRDLLGCWSVLRDPGVILGDDYGLWGTVTQAVDQFARDMGLTLTVESEKYVLCKGSPAIGVI